MWLGEGTGAAAAASDPDLFLGGALRRSRRGVAKQNGCVTRCVVTRQPFRGLTALTSCKERIQHDATSDAACLAKWRFMVPEIERRCEPKNLFGGGSFIFELMVGDRPYTWKRLSVSCQRSDMGIEVQ